MPIGRPPIPVKLSEEEELESMTRSLKLAHGLVRPAPIIPACAKGEPQVEIGKGLGLSKMTFSKWGHRFHHQGMAGLREEQRPGRSHSHDEQGVAEVLNRALQSPPAHGPIGVSAACPGPAAFPSPLSIGGFFSCLSCGP